MTTLHKILIRIFSLLFGDFNGVQVFLYPMSLFYWIETESFLVASSGLMTSQKFYIPLVVFLLILILMGTLAMKNLSALVSDKYPHPEAEKTSFIQTVIGMHKLLLLILGGFALIFLATALLNQFYGLSLPLQTINLSLARLLSAILILYYALRNSWTQPYREQGMDLRKALAEVRRDYGQKQTSYLLHGALYVMLAVVFSAIYHLVFVRGTYLVLTVLGVDPNLYLAVPSGLVTLLYDIFVLFVAMLISNLLFAPLVKLAVHLAGKFHPHRFITSPEAANG